MLLNVGCGTHYADGWVNCDVWEDELTTPDFLVEPNKPYPFPDNSAEAIYVGHVLEHMPWDDVFPLLEDLIRVARPGAPMFIVGPDTYRVIKCWAAGTQPWHMIPSVLEHQGENFQPGREHNRWDGAPHYWNCHEARVTKVLDHFGLRWWSYSNSIPCDPAGRGWTDPIHKVEWPVVGYHEWQFAVMSCVTKPTKLVVERPHTHLGTGYLD